VRGAMTAWLTLALILAVLGVARAFDRDETVLNVKVSAVTGSFSASADTRSRLSCRKPADPSSRDWNGESSCSPS
jgi:hypothetical protein